jgi:NAD(P)-dependent dehydrogenase (short-subunit alcohol dehydrogenase family)
VYCGVRKTGDGEALLAAARSGKVIPIVIDVTKAEDIEAVATQLAASDLPLVAVVNNAGVGGIRPWEYTDEAYNRWIFDVNYFGAINLTTRLLSQLKASKGRVIYVSSVAGVIPASPGWGVYAASKAAGEMWLDSLRQEMEQHGVSVSGINPAMVTTPIISKIKAHVPPAEGVKAYPNVWGPASMAMMDHAITLAEEAAVTTTPTIIDSITNPFPKTRYYSSNFDGTPAFVAARLMAILPARAIDAMQRAAAAGYAK